MILLNKIKLISVYLFIFLYITLLFSSLIILFIKILLLKDMWGVITLLKFIFGFYLILSLYKYINRDFENITKNQELIYDFIRKQNKFYTLDLFFLDLLYLIINNPILSLIILIIISIIKLKIIYIILLKMLITYLWTLHYFSLINTYKHFNVDFELKLDLEEFNYSWLKGKKIIILYFIKIPQLTGFLINYFLLSKDHKKIVSINLLKKVLYYRLLGLPLRLLLLNLKLIIFLKKIIKSVQWNEKKKLDDYLFFYIT